MLSTSRGKAVHYILDASIPALRTYDARHERHATLPEQREKERDRETEREVESRPANQESTQNLGSLPLLQKRHEWRKEGGGRL